MRQTVIGIFRNESDAQNAVQQLLNDGFTNDNVDISYNNSTTSTTEDNSILNNTYSDASSSYASNSGTTNYDNARENKTSEDFGDKISNFFSSLFSDEDDTKKYTNHARTGAVVTVHASSSDEAERAADLLDLYGAVDVDDDSSNTMLGGATDTSFTSGVLDADQENKSIPIIEEELAVGKREVETGRVRLRSRIVEKPVEESLRLRVERVTVERNPVNRVASASELSNFQGETIEVSETAEIPVVSKEARVVEEVRLNKEVDHQTETIRDTVRRTEVDIDDVSNNQTTRYED